ncbi:MAG TPA: TrmH family RNA methyltransferase, partial [Acidimicrobiales bacterium]|nr:TrmH family RNA methyltransferase [Acidimicrobiales bacterium]
MKNLGPTDLKRLHREWRHRPHGRLAVLLDGVQTPYNVGAIVRTAAAERVEHLYVAAPSAPPSHPTSRKVSLGTERYVEWSSYETIEAAVDAARDAGYQLVGLELADGAVPLHAASLRDDVCVVVGHEDRGLSPLALAACDVVAFVPQLGKVGSLNVAQAAAIGIYEVRRRSWIAGGG